MPADKNAPTRVLVTGVGGAAGVAVLRALRDDTSVRLFGADIDPYAAGLYLVAGPDRWLAPEGAAADFTGRVLAYCRRQRIDVLIPTVDEELIALADGRDAFADSGVRIALTGAAALRCALDKFSLAQRCAPTVPTPRTELLNHDVDPDSWEYPVIVKPRRGRGSRGIRTVPTAARLRERIPDEGFLVQEFLPGAEYSVDVLADLAGRVVAAVPRARLRVDSGVSVAGQTLHDPELDALARAVFRAVGLTLVANVQCRRDRAGRAVLLEVNPRFPGALPLTIASGVQMPRLCLDAVLGEELPAQVPFTDRIMVRFLEERFIEAHELARLTGEAAGAGGRAGAGEAAEGGAPR